MKIILLGYMGSGKSTIGKKLAQVLNLPFVDLDDYIEEKEGRSIELIFREKGEIYFRLIENTYLKEILNSDVNVVLSLGGGTPCYANNMDLIANSEAISFYLQSGIKTLVDRLIVGKEKRPLIASLENEQITEYVAKHLFERRAFYEQADFNIKIDDKTISEIITELRMLLY